MDFATKLLSIHDGTQVIIFRHKAHIDYMKQAWVSHMANIKEVGRRVVFAHDMSQLFSSLEKEVWEVESLNGFFEEYNQQTIHFGIRTGHLREDR